MKAPVTPSSVMLLGFFLLRADLNYRRPEVPDAGLPRGLRVLVGIDVLLLHLGREARILVEQVFAVTESSCSAGNR